MEESIESQRARRLLQRALNENGVPEEYDGPTWNTEQMKAEFEAVGFLAPFVVVIRKDDKVKGTLKFTHHPRVYFDWLPSQTQ